MKTALKEWMCILNLAYGKIMLLVTCLSHIIVHSWTWRIYIGHKFNFKSVGSLIIYATHLAATFIKTN